MNSEPDDLFTVFDKKALKVRDDIERAGAFASESVKRFSYHVIAIAAALYVVAVLCLLAAPSLLASANPELVDLGAIPYLIAALTFACHQMPERSFMVSGVPLPVCARCIGIYVGSAAGLFAPLLYPKKSVKFNSIKILVVTVMPLILDGVYQSSFAAAESPNLFRFATGLIFGFGLIVYLTHKFLAKYPDFRETIASKEGYAVTVLGAVFISYLAYTGLTAHLNIGYAGAVKAREIASFDGETTEYYLTPRAPLSMRADRFAGKYGDNVINDVLAMEWAQMEYNNLFNYSPNSETKPISKRHMLGMWAVVEKSGPEDESGKYAYTSAPGKYVYVDAWTGEVIDTIEHTS
ncbi:MAG: DUF2085 domain-containing protein [Candidatus Altiarchaeota archaeon]